MTRHGDEQQLQDTLIDAYYLAIPLVTLNALWFLASLPLITLFPASGALFYSTNRLVHGRSASWRDFVEGMRRYFWASWRWGLLNLLVAGGLFVNLWFYSRVERDWVVWIRGLTGAVLISWVTVQLFVFPLLIEQAEPRLWLALRNSVVLMLKRPWSVVGIALVLAAVILPSIYIFPPAWIIITASLSTYLANRVVVNGIQHLTQA